MNIKQLLKSPLTLPATFLLAAIVAPTVSGFITSVPQGATAGATAEGNRAVSNVYDNGPTLGDGSAQGNPATFSWSIVPDGTTFDSSIFPSSPDISDIVAVWDTAHGVAIEDQIDDLTLRPWFTPLQDALDLIAKRSGINYIYEPEDDGKESYVNYSSTTQDFAPGEVGVRGDLRLSGSVDTTSRGLSSTTPASLYYPDVQLNTDTISAISAIRFVFVHEVMHSLGFNHSTVNDSTNQSAVTGSGGNANGPQFDDIYGLHRKYGDFYEKNGGNDTQLTATDLGIVLPGQSVIIGDDANDTTVALDEFDFISIDDNSDTDFLKFTLNTEQEVAITLNPRGPTYTNRNTDASTNILAVTLTTSENSDLAFRLLNSSGQELNNVSSTGVGEDEVLTTTLAAGEYTVQITGTADDTQLYALEITTAPVANAQFVSVPKNGSKAISLSSSSASASYTVTTQPSHGVLSGTAPDLIYTPNTDYEGADSFTFYASNEGLDSDTVTVSIEVIDFADFVTIRRVSSGDDYDIPTDEAVAFRSTGVSKTYDADGDNAYGTEGYIFFTTGSGTGTSDFSRQVSDGASWVSSIDEGAGYNNSLQFGAYDDFDNPTAEISSDVADWIITGYARSLAGDEGTWAEIATFTVDENAPETFRVGLLSGNNHASAVNPSGLRLSVSGSTPVEVTGLDSEIGMVFFDISIQNGIATTFSLEAQRSADDNQTAIAGITFDLISAGYLTWTTEYPTLTDTSTNNDPDNDGIANLLEYVLNGDPTSADDDILPKLEVNEDNFIFSFTRLASSADDTSQVFQYTSTIDSNDWTDLNITSPQATEVTIGNPVNGLETVTVTINTGVEIDQKLFGRLKVTLP